ncbi:sensor histidine kinase [Microseira wollei]|nr:HAMP domain-containing sensor histidine kinase [Microseira wollei]
MDAKIRVFDLPIVSKAIALVQRLFHPAESADYQEWRQGFMRDRLHLSLWIIILYFLTTSASTVYVFFINSTQFNKDIFKLSKDPTLADRFRSVVTVHSLLFAILLVSFLFLLKTKWGKRHLALLFLGISWSMTLSDQIVGTFFGIPLPPNWTLEFLGQAILIPVCWRLHLLSQLVPIAYYACVYPLLGVTKIGERSIYDLYAIGGILNLFWVGLICDLAVYMYEKLQRAEFESRRGLRVFLHSVSHDLRSPVIGTSIVLQSLLKKPEQKLVVDRSVLERLLQGSDRQMNLINSLLEAHATEVQGITLNCEPLRLDKLVEAVLSDLAPVLNKNQVILNNRIGADLPLINGDATQLWRAFTNLISNAMKHNPHGITLTLDAEIVEENQNRKQARHPKMIRCTVADNGIGISPAQCDRLFELYAKGDRARYMPGLGLGLYLCKQIITAHGGKIGVISSPNAGSTFWFTLPLAPN